MIRDTNTADVDSICSIYNPYILNSIISFETEPVTETEMAKRISNNGELPWIVYEENAEILGYAYAVKWRVRRSYRYSVESGVYLDSKSTGRGLGTMLYTELINRLRTLNIHVVLGGIALPNPASVALHEKFGFTKVAHLKDVGYKFNKWIDVGYWQLILE